MEENNPEIKLALWKRVGASVMVSWATLGFPAVWATAYAQGLPSQTPTTAQIEDATGRGKEFATEDAATSDTLINARAQRILRSQFDNSPIRAPKIMEDQVPVRLPNLTKAPDDEANAKRAAAKLVQHSQKEIVEGAQRGSDIGASNYGQLDMTDKTLETDKPEPGKNQTGPNRVNATEIMPGFSKTDMGRMQSLGQSMYNDPASMKGIAEANKRNLRREGCRKTNFLMLERQNIDLASSSSNHRVLKVEFFDLVKQPIAGTKPVEYQTITQPSTFKVGKVDLSVATLGASATVWWDRVDEDHAIRYTYSPFSNPKERNFFTYNHWYGISRGAGIERVYDPALASYGNPKDGWKPVAGYTVPYGVTAAYLTADLYRTEVNFTEATEGVPCPPDPPEVCEVPSIGGDSIRWCPGSYGANIALMYDDQLNPNDKSYGKKFNDTLAVNAGRKDYSTDGDIRTGVVRGLNAKKSELAQELAGSCRRDSISRIEINQGKPYGVPEVNLCSESLVNPYPKGVPNMKRSFGLAYTGEHNFATVKAFTKVKVPINDPLTGKQVKDSEGFPLFTYVKQPANVTGSVRTNFTIMGAAMCPGENCSTEILPDDPRGGSEGYFLEYIHTPMGGDPNTFAFDGVYVQGGGVGSFSHFGKPSQQWLPTGTATADGTLHELRLMAKAYSVPLNTFAGADKYMNYVADGFCRGGKLTCVDSSATRTIGGVMFGPATPNSGIVDLLKKWGTDSSTVFPDYEGGGSVDPSPNGPAIVMLEDKMCWEAKGEPFSSCSTMSDEGGILKKFLKGEEEWVTDCNIVTDMEDKPLESSGICKRTPALDACDSRFEGLYTGQCYNPSIAYDCGVSKESNLPVVVEELGDSCTGAMRCMGTECHRPNLSGGHGGEFAQAVTNMEALNFMINEMVCAETGEAPVSASETCTPIVFGGKPMYCKIPVGNQVGLTPNCCKDAKKAAAGSPSWVDYLMAMNSLYKITRDETFKRFMSNYDAYNSTSNFFGEISKPITNLYDSGSSFVTENVIAPFRAGFDNLFGSFGSGTGQTAVATAVDAPGKAVQIPGISGIIEQFTQKLMSLSYDILVQIGGGSTELAAMVFIQDEAGKMALTEGAQQLLMMFNVYSIVRLIGHIIFACKQEEYEWGMNDRWRLCTYVGSCCAKKALFFCVENRQLYCCYKSIIARVMSEQIVKKFLVNRPYGYRTSASGGKLGKCNVNCGGFTPMELAAIDWSRIDLTEWTDSLVESGLFNPSDPRTNYGISGNKLESTMAVARGKDDEGVFDQRVSGAKTAEGWQQNTDTLLKFSETLRADENENCYVDDKKMPFTYPGCKTK